MKKFETKNDQKINGSRNFLISLYTFIISVFENTLFLPINSKKGHQM